MSRVISEQAKENGASKVALPFVSRMRRRPLQISKIQREDVEARLAGLRLLHSIIGAGSLRLC